MNRKKWIVLGVIFGISGLLILSAFWFITKYMTGITGKLSDSVNASWEAAKLEGQPAYLTEIDKLSSFHLNSAEEKEGVYIIKTTVTAPDVGEQLANMDYSDFPKTEDEDELNIFLKEQIEKADIKNFEVVIYAEEVDGQYNISFSTEFVDAMSGKLYSFAQKSLQNISEEYFEGELE